MNYQIQQICRGSKVTYQLVQTDSTELGILYTFPETEDYNKVQNQLKDLKDEVNKTVTILEEGVI